MERSLRRGSVLGKAATQRGPRMQLTGRGRLHVRVMVPCDKIPLLRH
jgi:hypothetical protein